MESSGALVITFRGISDERRMWKDWLVRIVKEIQDTFPEIGKLERFENADEYNPKKTVEIPKKLDNADVLFFAKTDGTSFVQCGEEQKPVTAVAITHYPDICGYYLFSLDKDDEVIGDFDCASIAEAMTLAEESHRVQKQDWIQLPNP